MKQRVQKIIANAGICSRRKAEELIQQGAVLVNGKPASLGSSAEPFKDTIVVEGKKIELPKRIYFAFNKPTDCLATFDDLKGKKTIISYVKTEERLMPAGRLDFDSGGLLFLTNDGDFANRIMHPRYDVESTYDILLDKQFQLSDIEKVKNGVDIDDIKTKPAKTRFLNEGKNRIELSLQQLQSRIVRRMIESLGYKVISMTRTKIGKVHIGILAPGKYRRLSYDEVKQFMR